MLRRALSIIAVIAVVVLAGAGVAFYGGFIGHDSATPSPTAQRTGEPVQSSSPSSRPSATPVAPRPSSTPQPSATPIDTNVHAAAVVVPQRSADLAMSLSGVVSTIYVHVNDQVIGGQLLLKLDQTKYLSDTEVATASVDQAVAQVNQATVTVDSLPSDAAPADVAAAQAALSLAQANLELAHSQLSAAQTTLRQTELRAPIAGIVASIGVSQGEPVAAGETIVSIGDTSAWLIETTDVSELDVVRLTVGDRATVTFTALPGQVVTGAVDSIQVRGTSQDGEVFFAVTIRPDAYLPQLRWNMSAIVSIEPSG